MQERQRRAFDAAMEAARCAYARQDWSRAFAQLERAHILGQRRVGAGRGARGDGVRVSRRGVSKASWGR